MKKAFTTETTEFLDIELVEGWYWPGKDKLCWPWLAQEHDMPEKISKHCNLKRTVIEAGGNAGFYVKKYAEIFENVITFEPDHLNFKCLTLNTRDYDNITRIQTCIGQQNDFVSLKTTNKNIGSYHIDVSENSVRNIPMLTIDNLNCNDCDLIHLDIEGWEFPALKGAVKTIQRCKPIIVVEWLSHGEKFGFYQNDIESFLKELGYTSLGMIYHDNVFVYNEQI